MVTPRGPTKVLDFSPGTKLKTSIDTIDTQWIGFAGKISTGNHRFSH